MRLGVCLPFKGWLGPETVMPSPQGLSGSVASSPRTAGPGSSQLNNCLYSGSMASILASISLLP